MGIGRIRATRHVPRLVVLAGLGLVLAGILLSQAGSGSGGPTFRDIAYNVHYCTLHKKSNKVLLKRSRKHPKASVGTLTIYAKCNYKPGTAARLQGIVTESLGKKHGTSKYRFFKVSRTGGKPKPGVRVPLVVKLPKGALRGLKKGRKESGSFQLNFDGPPVCPGCGSKLASLDIPKLRGVR